MTATTANASTAPLAPARWGPGSLIRARGREWIVLAGSDGDILRVRPASGSDHDQTALCLALEADPVTDAAFPPPDPSQRAGHDAALVLRDALLLSLRRGAGPFRSFGQIAVEPRAYQLVPLLMALKLEPVRLLVADDVGVGKTIEAALIARELLDRGDIQRFAVLCPPHLVEQWQDELEVRFHLHAVAVTATSAGRLERELPPSESIFAAHPHTVVSLDYIKSERRRSEFLSACPELVIVDEAHTCAATGKGRHQRYELLRGLANDADRHLVLLTATPHSGDEGAFFRLLGLIDRDFERLADATGDDRQRLRDRLSRHFVQRRRPDITEWQEGHLFPRRETMELTYKLTGAWEALLEAVLAYCRSVVETAAGDERRQRLSFWGTLALMRCVASSPAAAVQALRTRAGWDGTDEDALDLLESRVFDGAADALPEDDVEPPAATDDPALAALIAEAERLAGRAGDPKLAVLSEHIAVLLAEGFHPVVFCRYIATARYLGARLAATLPDVTLAVVTGELPSAERKAEVEALGDAERRLLVATDCLSEGVNLQDCFDAVVHYDLSWNPTRHEQREGRVDRFGQKRDRVRATLMYGANNPMDGAVLSVILRKAAKIREELGVAVPLPDEGHTLTQALLKAVLLRGSDNEDPARQKQLRLFDEGWQDTADKAKRSRTVFAQRRLKPEEVLPEWRKAVSAVGDQKDVRRFVGRALARLGAALEPLPRGFKAPLGALPDDVRERLEAEGLAGTLRIDFAEPAAPGCAAVGRSHPLVAVLAETLVERTLAGASTGSASAGATAAGATTGAAPDVPASAAASASASAAVRAEPEVLGRVGCWIAGAVAERTTIVLLRLRHQLVTQRAGRVSTLLVEEASALGWVGASTTPLEGADALALLAPLPAGDPPVHVRDRAVRQALAEVAARQGHLDAFAERRADTLLADHRRVREAALARGSYSVKASLPADVIGLFVLLPRVA